MDLKTKEVLTFSLLFFFFYKIENGDALHLLKILHFLIFFSLL